MANNICMTCYLNTGFQHPLAPQNQHEHIGGKIIFKYSLEHRVKADIEDSIEESRYKYYGVTPFRAEGTTLAKIVEERIRSSHGEK